MNNEPVAWMPIQSKHTRIVEAKPDDEQNWIPLYLHPAKELTDEEILQLQAEYGIDSDSTYHSVKDFVLAILRKAQE